MNSCQRNMSLILVLSTLGPGCAGEKERLVLENKLRDQETTIRELNATVAKSQRLLKEQDKELVAMRVQDGSQKFDASRSVKTVSSTTETATAWGSVASIRIHRMTSGVVSGDGVGMINVVVQPLDEDEELVKVAGRLKVTTSIIKSDGEPVVVASKDVDITESRRIWTRSLLSSGFHVQLDSTETISPSSEIVLTAILDLGQGRTFKTTEVIGND